MVCTVFPWAVICATYLRFRRVVKVQHMRPVIPSAAVSPWQPYLAYYGLVWTILISDTLSTLILIVVMFEGFEVFAIKSDYWNHFANRRLYDVAPYVMIGVLLLAVCAWLGYYRRKEGMWSLRIPSLQRANIKNGVAPVKPDPPVPDNLWKKWGEWILRNI